MSIKVQVFDPLYYRELVSFFNKYKKKMKKLFFRLILNKILKTFSYFFIVLFIMNLYNLIFGSPILFDSMDITSINDINEEANNTPKENYTKDDNSSRVYYVRNETLFNKTKRWFYWRLFFNRSDKYRSYDEFKRTWNYNCSLRRTLKIEFKNFKASPVEYLKEDQNNFTSRILEDNHNMNIKMKTEYLNGFGWLKKSQIDELARQGYEVYNNEIRKINK